MTDFFQYLYNDFTIWYVTLPRILVAVMAGALLASSGYILQVVLRNPIVDTGVVGINAGASFGAICALLLPNWLGVTVVLDLILVPAALTGAVLGALPMVLVAGKKEVYVTILTGVGVSALFSALGGALIFTVGQGRFDLALQWMAGSLYARDWQHVLFLGPWAAGAFLLVPFMRYALKLGRMDNQVLAGLGVNAARIRLALLIGAAIMAAPVVSVVGPIAFIGLVVPHIARYFIPSSDIKAYLLSILIGAVFLLISDQIPALILHPLEMPAGIFTALVGAPFFLLLLRKQAI